MKIDNTKFGSITIAGKTYDQTSREAAALRTNASVMSRRDEAPEQVVPQLVSFLTR